MKYTLSNDFIQVLDSNINVIGCIHSFDSDYDRLYVVDNHGKFNGMVIEKDKFFHIFEENSINWYRFLDKDEYITSIYTDADLQNAISVHENNSDYNEIPIIIDQKIISVLKSVKKEKKASINWDIADRLHVIEFLTRYSRICISSLQSQSMREFYRRYVTWTNIIVLNEDNIDDMTNNKYDLFVYEESLYDSLKINKLSIQDIHSIFVSDYFEWKAKDYIIGQDWPSLNIKNCTVLKCIKEMDKGYNSVYLVDDDNNYVATVCRHNFKEDLLQANFRKWNNVYVEYNKDEKEQMKDLLCKNIGSGRQDIPIIQNKKIVGNYQKKGYWNFPRPHLKWEYISEEMVYKYFKNKKILISSMEGELDVFYQKYSPVLDIDILDEKNLNKYFEGIYDVVIYLSDVWWNNNITIYLDIYLVYLDLLGLYADQYFKNIGVAYYYFESSKNANEILNYNIRNHKGHIERAIPFGQRSFVNLGDCYTYPNVMEANCHIYNGVRVTEGNTTIAKNNIYFYGACTSLGWNVKDNETIETYLQSILNSKDIYYNVINSGGAIGSSVKSDITTLHLILKKEYKKDDIIIQIGFQMWKSALVNIMNDIEYYRLTDLFNSRNNSHERYFMDWVPHINPRGNTKIAEYIYGIIRKDIHE